MWLYCVILAVRLSLPRGFSGLTTVPVQVEVQLGVDELATTSDALVSGSWLVWMLSTACPENIGRDSWFSIIEF
jgi:hypothetical protein